MTTMRKLGGAIVALLSAGLGFFAGNGSSTSAVGKEPRFPQLTMAQLTDEQRPLGEAIMKISSVGIAGPYNPMLRSPVFGQRMFDLLDYLRWHSSLPLRLNEFAILITGRLWRCPGQGDAHPPPPPHTGLPPPPPPPPPTPHTPPPT